MMRWDSFARSAVFAALAAALWPAWAIAAAPLIGWRVALAAYLGATMTLYLAGLRGNTGRPHRAPIVLAALGAVALAACAPTVAALAVGLAALLGCIRSALLYRARPAHAVAIELVLLCGGLIFAGWLASPSMLSIALALWAFFLVQSLFFLIAAAKRRAPDSVQMDPFDEAHRRAIALLECGGLPPLWGGKGGGV
jgi:hypothetical protein